MDLRGLLAHTVEVGGSDLHLKVGEPPVIRVDGELQRFEGAPELTEYSMEQILNAITANTPAKREHYLAEGDIDTSYTADGAGRFRVNGFRQKNYTSFAFRYVPSDVPSFDALGLPTGVRRLADEKRGLILVTGATGSGKTTSLAAMIDHMNRTRSDHIVTIEDPIEIMHNDKGCIVSQREIGLDTASFKEALRRVLRQDPDIILVGELRDEESATAALQAGESGHLVLSTMHTLDARETIGRMIELFPTEKQLLVRQILASTLRGVVSQRLLPRAGGGRVAAVEVMINTSRISDLIVDPEKTETSRTRSKRAASTTCRASASTSWTSCSRVSSSQRSQPEPPETSTTSRLRSRRRCAQRPRRKAKTAALHRPDRSFSSTSHRSPKIRATTWSPKSATYVSLASTLVPVNRLLLLVGALIVLAAPATDEARIFSVAGSSDAHVFPTADSPNLPGSVQIPLAILRPPTRQQELSFEELVRLWKLAGAEYDVPWQVLAAINKVEPNFGRNMGPSTANAVGWMQFLPSTWLRWGVDGDGDGISPTLGMQPTPCTPRPATSPRRVDERRSAARSLRTTMPTGTSIRFWTWLASSTRGAYPPVRCFRSKRNLSSSTRSRSRSRSTRRKWSVPAARSLAPRSDSTS